MTDMRKVIYHYCGVDALCKILESKTLRLSDCYFMNDYMEHRLLLEKASKAVESLAKKENVTFYKRGGEELSYHLTSVDTRPDIACFSTMPDSLSQWRAYSDNGAGFAIGFSTEGLRKLCDERSKPNEPAFMLRPVEYDTDKHNTIVENIVTRYFADYEKHSHAGHSAVFMALPWQTYCELWRAAALSKNPGFKEENEYRIVLEPSQQLTGIPGKWVKTVGSSELAFRVSGNRLIPFYTFPFTAEDVVEIHVGPRFPDRESHYVRA